MFKTLTYVGMNMFQIIRTTGSPQVARWYSAAFCWVIRRKEEYLTMMRNYFGERLTESNVQEPLVKQAVVSSAPSAEANTLLVVKYLNGRVRLIFKYDKEPVKLIKTLPLYE